jgi:RNA-directed DNA polymerase
MNPQEEDRPAIVAAEPKQAGEARDLKWWWVEPSVWTERMLEALERGVKGGQWFALIDKVYGDKALRSAFSAVEKNRGAAGCDGQRVERFASRLDEELAELGEELRSGKYRPQPVRRVWIEKEGSAEKRPLGIPAVRDRVVQRSLRAVLEPIFERDFAAQSYGFRPGSGAKDALRRVSELLAHGCHYIVDADLKSYFDSIPQDRLLERVREKVRDGRVLALLEGMLKAGVLSEQRQWEPTEKGTPQGAVISPLLANIYLHPLDVLMAQSGVEMVRYADDFIVLTRSVEAAQRALEQVRQWVEQAGLQLHPQKTRVVDLTQPEEGFDFLGYHFHHGGKRWPRRKSEEKLKARLRPLTRRNHGESMQAIIAELNPILRGWYGYFRHSSRGLIAWVDSWVRGRLRSILRQRQGRCGRARGKDHQRWPNAYFARRQLFSLQEAWAAELQSQR